MKSIYAKLFYALVSLMTFNLALANAETSPAAFVNPFIGTAAAQVNDAVPGGKGGATQPAAVVPFGMVQLGPDTDRPETSGYNFANSAIRDFSFTHMSGPGCRNMAEVAFLPIVGQAANGQAGWKQFSPAKFIKNSEKARPGNYSVQLENGIIVDLTATTRTGMAKILFPKSKAGEHVTLLLNTSIHGIGPTTGTFAYVDDHRFVGTIKGGGFCGSKTSYDVHYFLEFDRAAIKKTFSGGVAQISFVNNGKPLLMKGGISFVSKLGAQHNLNSENPDFDFEKIKNDAFQLWHRALSTLKIDESVETDQKIIFYTALYHSLLHPNIGSDVDGKFMGFDGKPYVRQTPHYVNFSGWDIYRSQVQLLAMLFPERASDMAQSLVSSAYQCGALPKWALNNTETNIMVGDPGTIILANFHAFGAKRFNTRLALDLVKRSALNPLAACNGKRTRPALADYMARGFIPQTELYWGSAAVALEFVSADFAASEFAKALGDVQFASQMYQRSNNWKNNWDPSSRAIRPRLESGTWLTPFDVTNTEGFVEGNSAQYTWMIPFDLGGLIEKMGGDQMAIDRLDKFLSHGNAGQKSAQLYLGNEPAFSVPWTYLWAHAPERTQDAIRRILKSQFNSQPNGLPGNDDLGATSSWYVFAAIGFYPQIPGRGGLVVGSPMYPSITLQPEGKSTAVKILAPNAQQNVYVSGLSVDGREVNTPWISINDFMKAQQIEFSLNANPQKWGSLRGQEPPSR